MSTTYVSPWELHLQRQENTTTLELESTPKQRPEPTGQKSIEWAAGLFEGEGTIYYDKYTQIWVLCLDMTDEDVVNDFAGIWNLKVTKRGDPNKHPSAIARKNSINSTTVYKQAWRTKTGARDRVFEIVSDIYPYMGERRRQKMDEFFVWYDNLSTNV